ncbi:unnamed protein product [Paramecium primaurelia]|uniref:Uncharacterized protein n=1 Tax=Paramecium primaurelia TaxID=5886 RepID=A0A8S1NK55_PARPR|nr:unnamed protein product [Paramecium primaurelia]
MNREKSLNQKLQDQEKDYQELFEYQLYAQLKQKDWCQSMAFIKGNQLLIIQCKTFIKVLSILQGQIKQIKILSSHKTYLTTITILQKINLLISTSQEGYIHIWSLIPIAKPIIIKKFDATSSYVGCLIYNERCDLIITGNNNIIKFWKNPMKWFLIQSINDHAGAVWALSLNQNENKLISCGWDKMILVIGKQSDENWIVTQKVFVQQYGYRICFLDNDQFLYQPRYKKAIILYQILENGCQVEKVKEIELTQTLKDCNAFFPMEFVKQKKIILNKNGDTIILLKAIGQGEIQIMQFIYFESHNIFGKMSEDGQLLAIWDESKKNLQIRKLQYYSLE